MKIFKSDLKFLILGLLLLMLSNGIKGQSLLKQNINIRIDEQRFEDALISLAEAGDFSFSYNPDLLPVDSIVNLNIENSNVKEVLTYLLGEDLKYRISGNHLVILKTKYSVNSSPALTKSYTIDGRLQDEETGAYVASATVYDVNRLYSTSSDESGYFSLELPSKDQVVGISVTQPEYEEKTIVLVNGDQNLDISLEPLPGTERHGISSSGLGDHRGTGKVNDLKITKLMASTEGVSRSGQTYVSDTRFAQASLLPFVGTNLQMSGVVENKISLNVMGGYNGAVNGFELGGIVNITRYHAKGVQLAGIGNVTGTETVGFQMAGIFNTNLGTVKGVQFSGINNLVLDSLKGVQLAGINNVVTDKTYGLQISGINNLARRDVDGWQLAGISNVAIQDVNNFQLAGITNFGRNVDGGQLAGLLNTSYGQVSGFQVAGLMNIAQSVKSVQMSGLLNIATDTIRGAQITAGVNYTRNNRGLQFGIVNIADTVSGVSIALLNLVWKGYNKIELNTNEILPISARVKFGTHHLYTIAGIGTQGFASGNIWGYSVGFGGGFAFKNKPMNEINFDATLTDLQDDDTWFEEVVYHSRFSLTYSRQLIPKLAVFAGPSWSLLHYEDNMIAENQWITEIPPYTMYERHKNGWSYHGWIGFEFGLRLL